MPRRSKAEKLYAQFMAEVGIDMSSPHAKDTPRRVTEFFGEYTTGLREPDFKFTTFPKDKNHGYDQVIVERSIPLFSLCAHHHLPFYGKCSVGYLPDKTIVGLSKIVRAVQWQARKPSIQEDLTEEIADLFAHRLKPRAVFVLIQAEHLCVACRGVSATGVTTVTHAIRGEFAESVKSEFLSLSA